MALIISHHAAEQMSRRGLTESDINWCFTGGVYYVEANGRRHYSRAYDSGHSFVHVLTNASGTVLVTAWIRGRLDPGA
jgi:hypothetical protein